jgi:hypothetical protein
MLLLVVCIVTGHITVCRRCGIRIEKRPVLLAGLVQVSFSENAAVQISLKYPIPDLVVAREGGLVGEYRF